MSKLMSMDDALAEIERLNKKFIAKKNYTSRQTAEIKRLRAIIDQVSGGEWSLIRKIEEIRSCVFAPPMDVTPDSEVNWRRELAKIVRILETSNERPEPHKLAAQVPYVVR